MKGSGLDDFRRVWSEFRRLWVGLASASVPFLAAFSGVTPPWPKHIALLTAVFQLMAIMYVYQTQLRASRREVSRNMRWSAIIFCVAFFLYLFVFSQFAIYIPGRDEYLIVGFECTKKATEAYPGACSSLGLNELARARYDEFELWTRFSISATRVALTAMWCLFFVGLSVFVGEFIVFQKRQSINTHKNSDAPDAT
jgi:hypothetical protein